MIQNLASHTYQYLTLFSIPFTSMLLEINDSQLLAVSIKLRTLFWLTSEWKLARGPLSLSLLFHSAGTTNNMNLLPGFLILFITCHLRLVQALAANFYGIALEPHAPIIKVSTPQMLMLTNL